MKTKIQQKSAAVTPIPARYITAMQAASVSGYSHSQIKYLCRRGPENGGLVCVKVNPRLWMVDIDSLDQYMATEHKPGPKPKEPPAS